MAQEIDESASSLRALKQSSAPSEGPTAAPARETGAEKHPVPDSTTAIARERFGAEKRRSTRCKCEGSAGMRGDGHVTPNR
jgi:hypothetical protein